MSPTPEHPVRKDSDGPAPDESAVDGDALHGAPGLSHEIPGLRLMAALRWVLLALVAALAAGTWWTLAIHPHADTAREARFHCPMHPEIRSADPGTCPICSMRLEPIPEGGADAPDEADDAPPRAEVVPVMLTLERRLLAGLGTEPVARGAGRTTRRLSAVVESRQGAMTEVRVRTPGFIERAPVRETGVRVRQGTVLAWVFAPAIVQAEEEWLAASNWEGAPGGSASLVSRARERLLLLGVAEGDLDASIAGGRASRTVPLRAPAGGVVVETRARVGAAADPAEPLYVLSDLGRVWVVARGPIEAAALPAPGQAARFLGADGRAHDVRLERVLPSLDPMTRGAELRFVADNPALSLVPGAIGEVVLEHDEGTLLTVPRDAVIETGRAAHVFVERGHGLFEPRTVTLGPRVGERRAIVAGLEDGERVVTRGTFVLDSESRLAAATAPAPAQAPVPGGAPPGPEATR